jgi:hypothetical protein
MNLDHIGKYRVVQKIGKGAMGEVYKAHDPLLNRYVAIKTIAAALASNPDFQQRFRREAQSAARLNHPNIVTVYDFGEEDGLTYMAMELLEGRDLRDLIRSRAAHLGEKLTIMEQLCEGLAFAHAKGVVHRDLKPGNVHIQPGGRVKILDFGLARLGESEMTKTGTVMGTPDYMSPEQVRGEKADARSDVFSLGAVFYELLSQHRPFEADSAHGVLFQILEHEPEPIRRWTKEVPPPIVAVVERALTKEPTHRYSDAGEMGKALASARDAMAGETIVGITGGADPASTLLGGGESTVVQAADPGQTAIHGATALSRAPLRARSGPLPRTVRPDPTVAGGPATQLPTTVPSRRIGLVAGAGVVVLGAVAAVLWMRGRGAAPALPPAEVAQEQVGILTETLVASQVELARADLAGHDYEAAARRAEQALKLSPENADAREVLDQAHQTQRQVQAAVTESRAAFARGDSAAATEALSRVMALDPRQPVIAELSSQLKEHFQRPAEEARTQATDARRAAERAQATSQSAFAEAARLSSDAEGLFRRQEFTAATQKFLQSKDAFQQAQREAEAARAAAARPAPSARPTPAQVAHAVSPPPVTRPAATLPEPSLASGQSQGPSGLAPSVAAGPSAPPQTTAAALPPAPVSQPPVASAASRGEADKLAVQRVIAEYKRALESQDVALYRQLYPGLTSEDEKNLRKAFEVVKSMQVGISPESVDVEGDRAVVRVTRQDVINGRQTKAVSQSFHLVRSGGAWLIQSIGQ